LLNRRSGGSLRPRSSVRAPSRAAAARPAPRRRDDGRRDRTKARLVAPRQPRQLRRAHRRRRRRRVRALLGRLADGGLRRRAQRAGPRGAARAAGDDAAPHSTEEGAGPRPRRAPLTDPPSCVPIDRKSPFVTSVLVGELPRVAGRLRAVRVRRREGVARLALSSITLLRVAPCFFIAAVAQVQVDAGRHGEPEALGHGLQI